MHAVNLSIGYTLGIKVNTKTEEKLVDGKMKKVQEIVTPGGDFPDGIRIIKVGRKS